MEKTLSDWLEDLVVAVVGYQMAKNGVISAYPEAFSQAIKTAKQGIEKMVKENRP
jgi:hypothetical protein